MENVIGQFSMYAGNGRKRSLRIYFHKHLDKKIGGEVVFNIEKLTLKKPIIDSKNVYEVSNGQITYTTDKEVDPYLGKYDVIQKDEDTFKLKKVKDAKLCGSN